MPLSRNAQLRIEEELAATAEADQAEMTTTRAARLKWSAEHRIHAVHICLENLRNPGNRAAITRSMDGFGLLHLHEIDWEDPAIADMVSHGLREGRSRDGRRCHRATPRPPCMSRRLDLSLTAA